MRVAAGAADFEIEVTGIERATERQLRLRWAAIAEHALVPCVAGKPVGFLAGSGGPLSAEARIDGPKMEPRDLVPMPE
jgi:hypothetical protein